MTCKPNNKAVKQVTLYESDFESLPDAKEFRIGDLVVLTGFDSFLSHFNGKRGPISGYGTDPGILMVMIDDEEREMKLRNLKVAANQASRSNVVPNANLISAKNARGVRKLPSQKSILHRHRQLSSDDATSAHRFVTM